MSLSPRERRLLSWTAVSVVLSLPIFFWSSGSSVGTVVAPEAAVKVYLTASEQARAQRRSADLAGDPAATVDATRREQATRDRLDAAQMVMAADAVPIDTTGLDVDEVVGRIVGLVIARQAMSGG